MIPPITVAEAVAAERKTFLKLKKARAKYEEARKLRVQVEQATLPTEPRYTVGGGPIVFTFNKRFGRPTGRLYTYAVIRIAGVYYLTRRREEDGRIPMTWGDLLAFMSKDEGDLVGRVYESITYYTAEAHSES